MKVTFRDIVWFAIIALVVLVLSKCHRDKIDELNKGADVIIQKAKQSDSLHEKQLLIDRINIDLTAAIAKDAEANLKANEHQLNIAQATVLRLAAAVKESKNFPVDTSFVTVSPEYVEYCDSLAINSEHLSLDFDEYKNSAGHLIIAKDSVINTLKETVNHERSFSTECRREFAAMERFYKGADERAKPRNQIFLGAELIGTPQYLINNVGAVISLKTKQDKLMQVSGGLQSNGGYYGRISASFLIKLRK